MADDLCRLKGISHDFTESGGRQRRVLEGIDLEVRPHEVLALVGPSGCGKSTLLRILAGLIQPTIGTVHSHGQPLHGMNPQAAVVFQSAALFPWLTVRGNVETALADSGLAPRAAEERAEKAVATVGLAGFADSYPRQLSGGMRQRAGLARALAVDRPLLLMDEPFCAVDALTAESLRSEVIDLWLPEGRNPQSVVIVSHNIPEAVFMADRIVVLGANPGRIRTIVDVPLPRPREYRSADFQRIVDRVHDLITGHELPDTVRPGKGNADFEPIPPAKPSEIVGLIEYLHARGGGEDLVRIGADTAREFAEVLAIAHAGELLGLFATPGRRVELTVVGWAMATADPAERSKLWHGALLRMRIFSHLAALLAKRGADGIDIEVVEEILVLHLPQEDHVRQLVLLDQWARFGSLFQIDDGFLRST